MPEPVVVAIPRDTVNDDSVLVLEWKAASGSIVAKDQLICEVETSKAVMEIHAPAAGLLEYTVAAGEEVPVGAAICTIAPDGQAYRQAKSEAPDTHAGGGDAADRNPAPPRLSAAARALAEELGVAASSFASGSLVRRDDVLRKAGRAAAESAAPAAGGVAIRWEELPRRKALEGATLQRGRALAVQSSVTAICRAAPLAGRLEELGLAGMGYTAPVIFETARLLRKYPMFNAVHDRGRIGLYGAVNLGWALDGGQGLVVPVIPEADRKTLQEIAELMERQVDAYVENALKPADFTGATFTVTDLSGLGASFFQPLIVPGQSAILGIGKGPDYQGETILHLTMAFDHQLSEGRKAAQFLQDLRERLETHASLAAAPEKQVEQAEAYCVICHRDSRTLQRLKLVLLKSEVPPGMVCSLCVAGW